ncbi:MAG: hypothetical protein WCS73_02280 [Lentisphaeria bacterium]
MDLPSIAQTRDPARSEWMKGYIQMGNADKATDNNALAAVQLYKEAKDIFEAVKIKYPKWNSSLLNFRIQYCKDKIAALEEKSTGRISKMSKEELADFALKQARAMQEMSEKIRLLNNNLLISKETMKRAQQESANSVSSNMELDEERKEKVAAQQNVTLLNSKVKELEDNVDHLKRQLSESDIGKLSEKVSLYKKQNKELSKQIDNEKDNLKKVKNEVEDLQSDNQKLVKKLDKKAAALAALEKEQKEWQNSLKQQGKDSNELQSDLKEAKRAIADLKEDLNRSKKAEKELNDEVNQLRELRTKFARSSDDNLKLINKNADLEKQLIESKKIKNAFDVLVAKNKKDQTEMQKESLAALQANKELAQKQEASEKANTTLSDEITKLKFAYQASQKREEKLQEKVAALTVSMKESANKTTEAEYKKITAEATAVAERKIKTAVEQQQKLKVALTKTMASEKAASEKADNLERQIKVLEANTANAKMNSDKLVETIQGKLEKTIQDYNKLQKQNAQIQSDIKSKDEQIAALNKKNNSFVKDLANMKENGQTGLKDKELLSINKELKKAQKEITALKEELADTEKGRNQDIEKAISKAHKEISKKYDDELESKTKELKTAREQLLAINALASKQQAQLQEKHQGTQDQLVRELEETNAKRKEAEETANLRLFKLDGNKVTIQNQEKEIQKLKTLLDKTAIPEIQGKNAQLLQQLVQTKNDLKNERELKLKNQVALKNKDDEVSELQKKLAALKEDLKDNNRQAQSLQAAMGSIELKKLKAKSEAQSLELKELKKQVTSSRETMLKSRQELENAQEINAKLQDQITQIKKLQKDFGTYENLMQNKDKNLEGKNGEIEKQADKLSITQKILQNKNDELAAANAQLQSWKRKYNNLSNNNQELSAQLNNLSERSGKKVSQSSELQAELQQTQQKLIAQNKILAKYKEDLEAKNTLAAKLEKSVQNAESQKNEQEALLEKSKQNIALLQTDLKISKAKLSAGSNTQKDLSDTQKNLLSIANDLKQMQGDFQASQSRIRLMNEQLERKNRQIESLQNKESQNSGTQEKELIQKISALNAKLDQEESKRKDLEIALIKLKNEEKTITIHSETQGPKLLNNAGNAIAPSSTTEQSAILRKQEKEVHDLLNAAVNAEKQDKTQAAIANYRKVLEIQPENRLAMKRMGLLAINNSNYKDTVKYLKKAFRLDTDDMDTLYALGYAMANLEQPEWAVSYLARASALKPDSPVLARQFGEALIQLNWKDAAEQQFKKAYKLDPKDPNAPFNLAVLAATDNPARLDEAKKWYNIALKNGIPKDSVFEKTLK